MPYNYKKQNGELMSVMSQGEKIRFINHPLMMNLVH